MHTGRNTELQARAVIAIWTEGTQHTCSIRTVAFSFPISDSCSHAPSKLSPPSLSVTIRKQHTRCQPSHRKSYAPLQGDGGTRAQSHTRHTHAPVPPPSESSEAGTPPPMAARCSLLLVPMAARDLPLASNSSDFRFAIVPSRSATCRDRIPARHMPTPTYQCMNRTLKAASTTIAMPCG